MKAIDPHADAFCRVVAEILIEQTKQETARGTQSPRQKRKAPRSDKLYRTKRR